MARKGSKQTGALRGRLAVVTGASSGIGRAIAIALSRQGVRLCIVGRNPIALAETAAAVRSYSRVSDFSIDLTDEHMLQPLVRYLRKAGGIDILVHCAGIIREAPMSQARIADLDDQYATNVRAPYLLTQCLLPLFSAGRGQIVFINSSAGLSAKRPDIGQYAATKHALKAIAESLREELNSQGLRVLSVYLGRTATPMQQALFRKDKKVYRPESLLQPEDVASLVVHSLMLPSTAEVTDISMRASRKSY